MDESPVRPALSLPRAAADGGGGGGGVQGGTRAAAPGVWELAPAHAPAPRARLGAVEDCVERALRAIKAGNQEMAVRAVRELNAYLVVTRLHFDSQPLLHTTHCLEESVNDWAP